jgi:hypothetical protein
LPHDILNLLFQWDHTLGFILEWNYDAQIQFPGAVAIFHSIQLAVVSLSGCRLQNTWKY